MEKSRLSFFRTLLDTPSPSGFEAAAQRVWCEDVRRATKDVHIDHHGNAIASLPGRYESLSFALLGHIDEIGLMVKYIDDGGMLYVEQVGGVDTGVLVGEHIRLLAPDGEVRGVIGKLAIHLQTEEQRRSQKVDWTDIWVDIGARNRKEAEKLCPVGTPAIFGQNLQELRNGRWVARDFDNKMGAFVVAEVLHRLADKAGKKLGPTVHGISTIQEECGIWGARTAAYAVNPTAAIAIDVSHATDTPDCNKKRTGDFKLGGGPIINIGVKTNKPLFIAFTKCAKKHKIPLQFEAESGRHGTDADPVSETRAGIPVITIGCPLRYMHTAVEMAEMKDIEQVVDAITCFLLEVPEDIDFVPR